MTPPIRHTMARRVPSRRHVLVAGLGTAVTLAAPGARGAEPFPSRPVRLIVAFAPGTGSDTLARLAAAAMAPLLGQPVVIDNRSGAGGAIGTEQGAQAAPDGYTLTLVTTSTLLTQPVLNSQVRYRADRDFAPVAGLARTAFVVVTAESERSPRSLHALIERLALQPGAFGSAGTGTITHLASEMLLRRAHAKAVHVPYRGSAAALTDVASGQLLFACDTLVAALPLIRSGKLRPLAVTSMQRLAALPAVPTAAESGIAGFHVSAWWGIAAPAGTPPAIVQRVSDAAMKALAGAELQAQLAGQQLEPMALPAPEFASLIRAELPAWTEFVRQSGIRLDS